MSRIHLYADNTIEIDLDSISMHLNELCKHVSFQVGREEINIADKFISFPDTFSNLIVSIKEEIGDDLRAIVVTNKQYDNNYFFQLKSNLIILSLYGWDHLTNLSFNNGLVFFIADVLALQIDRSFRHGIDDEPARPQCIYNFRMDKRQVDDSMRSALICPNCIERINKKEISSIYRGVFEDLKRILNDLGSASKWDKDIIDYWGSKSAKDNDLNINRKIIAPIVEERNQVFISYNHDDSIWLDRLRTHLIPFERNSVIDVWSDQRIKTGQEWKKEIDSALQRAKIAVLLVSPKFLASDFIASDELPLILKSAKEKGVRVMSIILKPCGFEEHENISKFQAVNAPSETLLEMDEAKCERTLLKLAREIRDGVCE